MFNFYVYSLSLFIITLVILNIRVKIVFKNSSIGLKNKQNVLIMIGLAITPVVNIVVSGMFIFLILLSEENFIKALDGELF